MPILRYERHSFVLSLPREELLAHGFNDRDHLGIMPGSEPGKIILYRTGRTIPVRGRPSVSVDKTIIRAPSSPATSPSPVQDSARNVALLKARSHISRIQRWSRDRPMPVQHWVAEFGIDAVSDWREHKLIISREGMPNMLMINPRAVAKVDRDSREAGL